MFHFELPYGDDLYVVFCFDTEVIEVRCFPLGQNPGRTLHLSTLDSALQNAIYERLIEHSDPPDDAS